MEDFYDSRRACAHEKQVTALKVAQLRLQLIFEGFLPSSISKILYRIPSFWAQILSLILSISPTKPHLHVYKTASFGVRLASHELMSRKWFVLLWILIGWSVAVDQFLLVMAVHKGKGPVAGSNSIYLSLRYRSTNRALVANGQLDM
jgi:hypothetical protein